VTDPISVNTVVGNLVDNALHAARMGPRSPAAVEIALLADGATLDVSVADSDPALPPNCAKPCSTRACPPRSRRGTGSASHWQGRQRGLVGRRLATRSRRRGERRAVRRRAAGDAFVVVWEGRAMIRTLIVDDDFRVAGAHAGFVEEVFGFTVVGTAHTAAEARARVRELSPDLVLLHVYLPDESGIAVLPELQTDTIVLSAAIDPKSIRTAIRAGALNYLIKPVTTRQLAERLVSYARYRGLLHHDRGLSQEEVNRAFRAVDEQDRTLTPKGQSTATSRLDSDKLKAAARPLSAEVAGELGMAQVTAQRYLTALAESA
jgi:two-component system CitB family response regulator